MKDKSKIKIISWLKPEQAMPKGYEDVLATITSKEHNVPSEDKMVILFYAEDEEEWWLSNTNYGLEEPLDVEKNEVIAWMPLPTRYRSYSRV